MIHESLWIPMNQGHSLLGCVCTTLTITIKLWKQIEQASIYALHIMNYVIILKPKVIWD